LTVVAEAVAAVDVDREAEAALDAATALVGRVVAEAGVERSRLIGVGMGVPGPFDRRVGAVSSSTILPGWVGRDAGGELARRLELQVEVDNDANLGALGELCFGAGRGLSDAVYVKLSTGIGAGLILNGVVHRGATGIAGEIGHVQVQPGGTVCSCGSRGCLQTVASLTPILAAARAAHGPHTTLQDLAALSETGDFGARRIAGEAGRAVGRVLADLCNHLNPQAIIVGGDLATLGSPLLAGIRETIDRHALPSAADAVQIKPGTLNERAEVLGALALIINDTERLHTKGLTPLPQTG
jgi:predicted NBD/HSP70 family sugar kinase